MAEKANTTQSRVDEASPSRIQRLATGFGDLECPICDARDMSGITVDLLQSIYSDADQSKGFITIKLGTDEFARFDFAVRNVFDRLNQLSKRWYLICDGAPGPRAI